MRTSLLIVISVLTLSTQTNMRPVTCDLLKTAWRWMPNTVRAKVLEEGKVDKGVVDRYIERVIHYCEDNDLETAASYAINDIGVKHER